MVAVGLGGLVLPTNPWLFRLAGDRRFDWFPGIGHYPRSLLGHRRRERVNAYPPTICFMLVGFWLIGLGAPAAARGSRRGSSARAVEGHDRSATPGS